VFSFADISSNLYFINTLAFQDLDVVCFLWIAFLFFFLFIETTATGALQHVSPYPGKLKIWGKITL